MILHITQQQAAELQRPVAMPENRQGGFQRLIVRLQDGIHYAGSGAYTLALSNEDAERVVHFAHAYGEGTYQKQLRAIADQVSSLLREAHAAQGVLL